MEYQTAILSDLVILALATGAKFHWKIQHRFWKGLVLQQLSKRFRNRVYLLAQNHSGNLRFVLEQRSGFTAVSKQFLGKLLAMFAEIHVRDMTHQTMTNAG